MHDFNYLTKNFLCEHHNDSSELSFSTPQLNLRYTCEKQYKHNPIYNHNQNQNQHQLDNHSEYGSRIDSIDICSRRIVFVVLLYNGLL